MPYTLFIKDIEEYVLKLFNDNENDTLVYHNLAHTEEMEAHTVEISANYSLNDEEMFILLAAAWFHDVGQLFVAAKHHEKESVKRMREYFETNKISQPAIEKIKQCIMATKFPSHPQNLLQEIICDADTYNFGTTKFKMTDELVRKEVELRTGANCINWHIDSLFLLKNHQFFTSYCREKLDAGKQQNIKYLQSLIDKSN